MKAVVVDNCGVTSSTPGQATLPVDPHGIVLAKSEESLRPEVTILSRLLPVL